MSRSLRLWLVSALALLGGVVLIAYFNFKLALGILWTVFHSESAISFWAAWGYDAKTATAIATISSFITATIWFWLAHQDIPWLKKFWEFGKKHTVASGWLKKAPYPLLPIASFVPDGGVWFSIALYKFFHLNPPISFVLISAGNIGKNLACGLFLSFFDVATQIILGMFALLLATIILIFHLISAKPKIKNHITSS